MSYVSVKCLSFYREKPCYSDLTVSNIETFINGLVSLIDPSREIIQIPEEETQRVMLDKILGDTIEIDGETHPNYFKLGKRLNSIDPVYRAVLNPTEDYLTAYNSFQQSNAHDWKKIATGFLSGVTLVPEDQREPVADALRQTHDEVKKFFGKDFKSTFVEIADYFLCREKDFFVFPSLIKSEFLYTKRGKPRNLLRLMGRLNHLKALNIPRLSYWGNS